MYEVKENETFNFRFDTGADVTVVSDRYFKKIPIYPTYKERSRAPARRREICSSPTLQEQGQFRNRMASGDNVIDKHFIALNSRV